ncbi:MAG: hypothetical protein ACOYJS_06070, partial [Acutalibacteraceae bacterium]
NGIKQNYLESLRKIYEAETLLINPTLIPGNISDYLYKLLTAVLLKKSGNNKSFDFYINVKGNYFYDKKVLSALILNICRQTDYLAITNIMGKIALKANLSKPEKLKKLIKKANGILFYEKKCKSLLIVLNLAGTEKTTADYEDLYSLYYNPLSPVNFYL